MYSVFVMKHLLERGVIVIHILEEPLLRELRLGQGPCEGLYISLHEVVVLGLITCGEVGLISRHHFLFGGVRSLLLPSRKWKKSSKDCRRLKENEKKRKLDGKESKSRRSDAHYMHG